jgi:hypothetical protein
MVCGWRRGDSGQFHEANFPASFFIDLQEPETQRLQSFDVVVKFKRFTAEYAK